MTATYLSQYYTIAECVLDDRMTGKQYRAGGLEIDLEGSVFANWLTDAYGDRIASLAGRDSEFRGLTSYAGGTVTLNGTFGPYWMIKIATAIGLRVTRTYESCGVSRGRTNGYLVEESSCRGSCNREEIDEAKARRCRLILELIDMMPAEDED